LKLQAIESPVTTPQGVELQLAERGRRIGELEQHILQLEMQVENHESLKKAA
jgi:hypothetical protein